MPLRRLYLRLSLATVVLLLLGLGTKAMAKNYAIEVETDPSGAKIYLNDKRGKLLGRTPYRGSLPAGEYTLYIRKNGFESTYQTITVKKKKGGRQEFYFPLEEVEFGRVKIVVADDTGDIDGARILIDGKEEGNAPDTIDDVPAGPHQVEVIKEGYEIFEAWIEVETGETVTVEVELDEDPDAVYDDDDDDADYADDGDDDYADYADYADADLVGPEPQGPSRHPYISVAIGPEAGNRSFQYTVPPNVSNAPNLRPYNAPLVPLVRIRAQLYPLAGAKSPFLSGWGFSGYYAQAASVTSETADMLKLETDWREWNANLRFKYDIGDLFVGTEIGLASQRFGFSAGNSDSGTLLEEVPSVDYQYTRLGLDVGIHLTNTIAATAGFNYRIVSGVGALVDKFAETQVTAFGGHLGLGVELFPSIRLQGLASFGRYTHLFIIRRDGDTAQAAGTDQFIGAMLGVAYVR